MTHVASSTFPAYDTWRSRLLNYIDEHATEIITDLAELVRIPSVSGSDSEIDIQHLLADRMSTMDLDVDTWQISLNETLAEPDFPGVEVDRSEAWGGCRTRTGPWERAVSDAQCTRRRRATR